jgi:hypothetical protein
MVFYHDFRILTVVWCSGQTSTILFYLYMSQKATKGIVLTSVIDVSDGLLVAYGKMWAPQGISEMLL